MINFLRKRTNPQFFKIIYLIIISLITGLLFPIQAIAEPDGARLVQERRCYACHHMTDNLIGPSYTAIAARHAPRKDQMVEVLAEKIIVGGAGNWGLVPMVPNEHVSIEEARTIAKWILDLTQASRDPAKNSLTTPEEVVLKVRKAAALLSEQGAAALKILRDPDSEFTWKDTYVFVVNCDADEVMANPAFPNRQGGDIKQHTDLNGKQYGLELCETAGQPGGGWVEYIWPKPGGEKPMRKISYVMTVKGQPYQLGAGIYNENITLDDLKQLLDNVN